MRKTRWGGGGDIGAVVASRLKVKSLIREGERKCGVAEGLIGESHPKPPT